MLLHVQDNRKYMYKYILRRKSAQETVKVEGGGYFNPNHDVITGNEISS